MANLYQQFRALLPEAPSQAGTVVAVEAGAVTVALPGGGQLNARGTAELGQAVFVRDGVVESVAPRLPVVLIEI